MTDFFLYRSCNLTDLGVRKILNRQNDIVDRGIALLEDPSGVPPDPAPGSDNPTLDIVTAEWGDPVDGNGTLPPGTYDYDIIPVDTCTGRTGEPIALPPLTIAGVRASGRITAVREADIEDGDTFTIDDGTNPPVTFEFNKGGSSPAVGQISPITGAAFVDGETFVLDDGTNPPVTFEFDSNGSVVETATLRQVSFTGNETVSAMSNLIADAINSAPALNIEAQVLNAGGTVSLTNTVNGTVGNQPITDTVADTDFLVDGMDGGSGNAETATFRLIELVGGESDAAVGALIAEAIKQATLNIEVKGGRVVELTNTTPGDIGNIPITQSGTEPLTVEGMAGGGSLGQTAMLRIQFNNTPSNCDGAQLRRNGVIIGPVFPLENVPDTVTVVDKPDPFGFYDLVGNTDPAKKIGAVPGSSSFRKTGGADLIGGDVVKYNGFTVKVVQVVGSGAVQDIFFEPPINSQLVEPEGFYDPANRSGFYEGFSTYTNIFSPMPGFGGVTGQYVPAWPPGIGMTWPGPIMSFKTIPNHVLLPLPLPFFNDIQPGDIIAYGSKTGLVVYVETNPLLAFPQEPIPTTGTVLVIPFGILPIPPLPVGQFWVVYRSEIIPQFGFYYTAYNKPAHGSGPDTPPVIFPGFADFDDVGPTLLRGGVPADGGTGSGYAQGQINIDTTATYTIWPLDGESIVISDGVIGAVTFQFDATNSVVETPLLRRVPLPTATHAITAVNTGADWVEVAADLTADLVEGDTFYIANSTGNDGTYTIDSITYTAPNTRIVVNENIANAIADGDLIYVNGTGVDLVDALETAINSSPGFFVKASVGAVGYIVQLKNVFPAPGTGNVAIINNVAAPEFVTAGMAATSPTFNQFLSAGAYDGANIPANNHHRLNAFRVLGNGQGGFGPPSALRAGQMLLIDGQIVTVNEVTELIPPGGFPGNPLPGFPGTYEVNFDPELSPDPNTIFPGVESHRPISPIGPWVTIPSFVSPYLKTPKIEPTGQYERLTRLISIRNQVKTWQWEETGEYQDRSGDVDGTDARDEVDRLFVQNSYPDGLDGLLNAIRGPRDTRVSNIFVLTNGDLTRLGDRLIAVNKLAGIGNGTLINLTEIRELAEEACDSYATLKTINEAVLNFGYAVLRLESREVQLPAAKCPPGQPNAREVRLFCLGLATENKKLQAGENCRVIWGPDGRQLDGVRTQLQRLGLTLAEADGALNLETAGRVLSARELTLTTIQDITDLDSLGTDGEIDNLLGETRIIDINTGTLSRPQVQRIIRRRGNAGIVKRPLRTDPAEANDPNSAPVDDFIQPMHRLAGLALSLQASFDICDYDGAIQSIPDPELRNQVAAFFAVIEGQLDELVQAGRALTDFFDQAPGFQEALDAISGIVSGSDSDPTMACLAGPIAATGAGSFSLGGIAPPATLQAINGFIAGYAQNFQQRFNLTSLFGQALMSVLCQTQSSVLDLIGSFGGETAEGYAQRGIGCLPSVEDLTELGIDFPSLEVQIALECSLEQLNVIMDIIAALISEANEVIDFGNALGSGFTAQVVEARNNMCSADQDLASLVGGVRAYLGIG